jgi:hypothetical protein
MVLGTCTLRRRVSVTDFDGYVVGCARYVVVVVGQRS